MTKRDWESSRSQRTVSLAAVGVLAALLAGGLAGATPKPDFSGAWVRDERASEDLLETAEAATPGAPGGAGWGVSWPRGRWGRGRGGGGVPGTYPPGSVPPGGAGGGGGVSVPRRGGPGRGAPGGGAPGQRPRSPVMEQVADLAHGIESWRIEHRDPQLVVRDANRETRVLFTDGRALGDGLGTRTVATWRGETLVIETRGAMASRTESWTLDPDRTRLVVLTDLALGRGEELRFRTVYERVGGNAAEPSADGNASAPGDRQVADAPPLERTPSAGARPLDAPPVAELPADAPPLADDAPPRAQGAPPLEVDGADDAPSAPGFDIDRSASAAVSIIRLLPPARPHGGLLSGKILFETLTIDPEVAAVEFLLDGERIERRNGPPFEAKVTLAHPPREQVVRAVAYAANDRILGEDAMVVNRRDPPFRVHVASIVEDSDGALEVRAEVSIPRRAELERVAFFVGERAVAEMTEPPFQVRIPESDLEPDAFVRVVATLGDGRELEDVSLLAEGAYGETIDVQLVELQVLVTDRTGAAVSGLGVEDFEILEGGKPRQPERLYPSDRVALLVGLAVDSSGSMWPMWDQTRAAAHAFLDATLGPRDRAFLVDFDSRLRLLEPATQDRQALAWALERLQPHGGTALYDSILFSLLQYEGEPGRRALVVLTDGVDSESRSDPRRAIDFGRRLGVPVYVIALDGGGGGPLAPGLRRTGRGAAAAAADAMARNELRLVTDPTGGRLFHAVTAEQVSRAFTEIQAELRRQYVLTYYTDRPPGEEAAPVVEVRRPGLEVRSAVPLPRAE